MDIQPLIVYNKFYFPWRIPSWNDLTFQRGITGKQNWILTRNNRPKRGYIYNGYNEVKQEWANKVCKLVKSVGFVPVKSAYFHYLLVEPTLKRDPSNICGAAFKLLEDGLIKAGVIENDGWKQVLGIRPYWILDRESEGGVFLLMSNESLSQNAVESYYNTYGK